MATSIDSINGRTNGAQAARPRSDTNGLTGDIPRLLGADGQPLPRFLLPHVQTFQSAFFGGQDPHRTYRWTFDEALKHSVENALAMRRDAFIMGCLRERQRPVAAMPWHIEPEDSEDPAQEHVAEVLTKMVQAIPRFRRLRMCMAEARWYGRYGVQLRWEWEWKAGRLWLNVKDHQPVNGDKIGYTQAGAPYVYIYTPAADDLKRKGAKIILTELGYGLLLDQPYWRERFIINKHEVDDADYRETELAGGIHGVGIRHRIYWMNWLKLEVFQWLLDAAERQGTGVWIFYYEAGNAASEEAARKAAVEQSRTNVVVWPRPIGAEKQGAGVEFIPVNAVGLEFLMGLITDYFDGHIRRFIVGQELSSKSAGVGLGSGSGQSEFQAETKQEIIAADCDDDDETLTEDLIGPMKRHNFPEAQFRCKFVSDVSKPDPEAALNSAKIVYDMGVPIDANEVRGLAGLSEPKDGAETVQAQQQSGLGGLAGIGMEGKQQDADGNVQEPGEEPFPDDKPEKNARSGTPERYGFDPNEPRDAQGRWTADSLHQAHGKEVVSEDGRILAVTRDYKGNWSIGRQHGLDSFSAADVLNEAGATIPPELFEGGGEGGQSGQPGAANPLALKPKKASGKKAATLDFSQGRQKQPGLFARDGSPSRYAEGKDDSSGGTWITVGGTPGEKGEHEGGTPVKIDAAGRILAGPAGLAAKGIKSLSDFGGGGHKPATAQQPKQPHEMTLDEFEQHLIDSGQRKMYGQGTHGVLTAYNEALKNVKRKQPPKAQATTTDKPKGKDKTASKPTSKADGDGPYTHEDMAAEISAAGENPNDRMGWKNAEPLGISKIKVDPKVEADVARQVADAARRQKQTNSFQRLDIKQLYGQIGKPAGLSVREFQAVLARAHAGEGASIRLGPYTQNLAGHPDPRHLLPMDLEHKFYVEPREGGGGGPKAEPAAKPAPAAAPAKSFRATQDDLARSHGLDPETLHGQAKAILDAENEYRGEVTKMMHNARQSYADRNPGKSLTRSMKAFKGGGDLGNIAGFDALTETLMSEHPGLLGGSEAHTSAAGSDTAGHQQKLYDLLNSGTPQPMPKEEAYKKAWQILSEQGMVKDDAEADPMEGHPLQGVSDTSGASDEAWKRLHAPQVKAGWKGDSMSTMPLSKPHLGKSPPIANEPEVKNTIAHELDAQYQKTSTPFTLGELYNKVRAAHPNVSIMQYQDLLAKLDGERNQVMLTPYTQDKSKIPDLHHAMVHGQELKYYVRKHPNAKRDDSPVPFARSRAEEYRDAWINQRLSEGR